MPGTLAVRWDTYTRTLEFGRATGNFAKRGETLTLAVTILNDGAAGTAIPTGTSATIKQVNSYGTSLVVWTGFAQVGSTNVWQASTTLTAAEITTLLGVIQDRINCVMDFGSTDGAASDTLAVVLENNVTRSDDVPPSPAGAREFYAGQVDGYADGTWAAAVATVSITVGMLYKFVDEDGILRSFILKSSSSATTLPGIRRAMDYNASTNQRVWFQVA